MNFNLFKDNTKQNMLDHLLDANNRPELVEALTTIQNEISVGFNTKVIAVTSIRNERLAAAFAKGLGEVYGVNGAKSLVIDANLYNPCLAGILGSNEKNIIFNEKCSAICLDKEVYPADIYKSGAIQKLIKEHEGEYDHFIIIVPELKAHKEIFLLKDILQSIILISQRNVTKKQDIFNAIQFCRVNELPIAKTVVVK